jgi:hypothetical protein
MIKNLLLALLFVLPAQAQTPETDKSWFIQVWTEGNTQSNDIDDSEDPGRIEVSVDNKFVACVKAFTVKGWNSRELIPVSIGFVFKGDQSKLKFESFEATKRQMKLLHQATEIKD